MWIKRLLIIVIFVAYFQSLIFPVVGVTGTVKLYNTNKSFGFIAGDDGKDYFVHVTGLKTGTTIAEGDRVRFEIVEGEKGPKADLVEKISLDLGQESNISNLTEPWEQITKENVTKYDNDGNLSGSVEIISNGSIQNVTIGGLNQNPTMQKPIGQNPNTGKKLHLFGPKPQTSDSEDKGDGKSK
jgi:CspA family cold shock protein